MPSLILAAARIERTSRHIAGEVELFAGFVGLWNKPLPCCVSVPNFHGPPVAFKGSPKQKGNRVLSKRALVPPESAPRRLSAMPASRRSTELCFGMSLAVEKEKERYFTHNLAQNRSVSGHSGAGTTQLPEAASATGASAVKPLFHVCCRSPPLEWSSLPRWFHLKCLCEVRGERNFLQETQRKQRQWRWRKVWSLNGSALEKG